MPLEELYQRTGMEKFYETRDRVWELEDKIGFNREDLWEEEKNAWRTKSVASDHDTVLSIDLRYHQRFAEVTRKIRVAHDAHDNAVEEYMKIELANHAQGLDFWIDYDDVLWVRGLEEWTEEEMMNKKQRDETIHRWMESVSTTAGSQQEPEAEQGLSEWEAKSLGTYSCLTERGREENRRWRAKIQAHREEGERLRASFGLAPEYNFVERCFDTERGRFLRYARSV